MTSGPAFNAPTGSLVDEMQRVGAVMDEFKAKRHRNDVDMLKAFMACGCTVMVNEFLGERMMLLIPEHMQDAVAQAKAELVAENPPDGSPLK